MIYIVLILLQHIYHTPLLIIPNIKLVFFFANGHYFENFKSLGINTPRYLSSSTDLTQPSFIWYWNSKFLFPIFITPHLFTLKFISHLFSQTTNLSKVLCIDLISLRVFTRLAIFVSSANLEISQSTSSSISSFQHILFGLPLPFNFIHL